MAVAIVLLALPPTVIRIVSLLSYRTLWSQLNSFRGQIHGVNSHFENLPSPFNCSVSNTLSPTLSIRCDLHRYPICDDASNAMTPFVVVRKTFSDEIFCRTHFYCSQSL